MTFISNLMLLLICQEVPDFGPEDGDPWDKEILAPVPSLVLEIMF